MKAVYSKSGIVFASVIALFSMAITFQNCSSANFGTQSTESSSLSRTGDPQGRNDVAPQRQPDELPQSHGGGATSGSIATQAREYEPTSGATFDPPNLNGPVVCDPLSPSSGCSSGSHEGLVGNLYTYPNGVGVDNYIQRGTRLPVMIQMSHFDIPTRSFSEGFPGPNGPLTDLEGNRLLEYFALDLQGYFTLPAPMPSGDYEFATYSDDGSIVNIGTTVVVNNDGTHSSQWKCGTPIRLNQGERKVFRVRYYQGPRDFIALRVLMRAAGSGRACNDANSWQVIPPEGISN